jgi:RHS repeat-associated protein
MNLSSKTTFSNGSITNLPSGDTLTYDSEGNLACVSNTVSGAVSLYWYDQHGRRIAKQENGLLTLYVWDGMDIIATAHADGTLREYFTRGIGIAGDVGSLIAETRFENNAAVSTTYLHSNWRGDVVMATDTAGNVVGEYSYTTFGEQLSATGTYIPRFTFSSKERDASGLVYHGFRYYNPVLCRWISEDPIRENEGVNLYQFCGNDPINGIDPYGEFTWSEWKEIGGAFAEGFGKGIAAGVDGMIPFADPFTGVYADDCGNVSIWTKKNDTLSGHVDCIDMLFTEQIIEFPVQIQVLASDLGALQHTDSLQLLEILRRGLPLRNAGINQKLAFGVGLAENQLYKACRSW